MPWVVVIAVTVFSVEVVTVVVVGIILVVVVVMLWLVALVQLCPLALFPSHLTRALLPNPGHPRFWLFKLNPSVPQDQSINQPTNQYAFNSQNPVDEDTAGIKLRHLFCRRAIFIKF